MFINCFLLVVKIEISLAKQEIFKCLCYSRAVNISRNASTSADYFAHSSAAVSGTGTDSSDILLAVTFSAPQHMKIKCKG